MNWKETTKTLCFTVLAVLVLRTAAFASYYIPSESMVPALEVGDRLVITKWDYGYSRHSLPWGLGNLLPVSSTRLFGNSPTRGDIVVFDHPQNLGVNMIKRVVGVPGDEIQMRSGYLYINGALIQRRAIRDYIYADQTGREVRVREFEEDLLGLRHTIIERSDHSTADNTPVFHVPAGQFFMMGDNRDNSSDSRFQTMSYVPLENIIGRARILSFSLHTCPDDAPHLTCAPQRILTLIN